MNAKNGKAAAACPITKRKNCRKRSQPETAAAAGQHDQDMYLSPRELAARWKCARSTADRIVTQAGLTRLLLGEGRNGMVRYLKEEVAAYEASRRT